MERTCLAFIHKDLHSSCRVTFPDFPGGTSGGDTFEESSEMARETLVLCREGLTERGDLVADPRSASDVLAHPDAADAVALIVVGALPERTEEAQAEFDDFRVSEYGQEFMQETAPEWEPATSQ